MIAHKIDLFALHEIAIANAVPKPMPAFAAVAECLLVDLDASELIDPSG